MGCWDWDKKPKFAERELVKQLGLCLEALPKKVFALPVVIPKPLLIPMKVLLEFELLDPP